MDEEAVQLLREHLAGVCAHVRVLLIHAILATHGQDDAPEAILDRVADIADTVLELVNYGRPPQEAYPLTVEDMVEAIYAPEPEDPTPQKP